ncbi:MAG: hypothetical protein FWB91_10840 [Defluviitaleaceae bacterium]|nr:hypothetical protein [Defluviitaleaceae bacterium]
MNGRDLFEIWAPIGQERWTKFAKPALFTNIKEYEPASSGGIFKTPGIPMEIALLSNKTSAIIVDLPGVSGVESGLALAEKGFRPVPLYNVVHEEKTGFLSPVIDNTPIVNALKSCAGDLQQINIDSSAPPAFLLDYDRNKDIADSLHMYDNRWSLDFEDMPDAQYMKQAGINRVIVWTTGEIRKDLLPIIESYQDMGIEVVTYGAVESSPILQEDIHKFENARVGLLLISGLAILNLFFMFFIQAAPLFWTAPSIMWLTYLWVPEIVGDAFAVALTGAYVALYFLTLRRRNLILAALIFFGFDAAVFYVYVMYYGLGAWIGGLGLILLAVPVVFLVLLIRGAMAQRNFNDASDEAYFLSLDKLDDMYYGVGRISRRRHFRGFRGYGGYGGSGRGGYRGGGYRGGYRGGYGGGFGG